MLEKTQKIYLDSSSGAPLHPIVVEALFSFLHDQKSNPDFLIANPSSQHSFGRQTSRLLEQTRLSILKSLGLSDEVYDVEFTGSGSEANQLAVNGSLQTGARFKKWFIHNTEHSSVLNLIAEQQNKGINCELVESDHLGEVGSLLSAMSVNNETGIISHIQSKTERHLDHIAGWGKVKIQEITSNTPEWIVISAYKVGGLPGVGALIKKKTTPPIKRSGTINILGVLSLKVIAENMQMIQSEFQSLQKLRHEFETWIKTEIPEVKIHGADLQRVPHISNIGLPLKKKMDLVALLDQEGFAVSSGSACNSGLSKPSHVLLAMGVSEFDAKHSIRISLSRVTTKSDLERLGIALKKVTLMGYESKT